MTPGQAAPSPTADPYATLPSKMTEQDWRNCFGLLQRRLKELEQRIRDLEDSVETAKGDLYDLYALHTPDTARHPLVAQADIERRDAETEIV
jgi:hypothetical protein